MIFLPNMNDQVFSYSFKLTKFFECTKMSMQFNKFAVSVGKVKDLLQWPSHMSDFFLLANALDSYFSFAEIKKPKKITDVFLITSCSSNV